MKQNKNHLKTFSDIGTKFNRNSFCSMEDEICKRKADGLWQLLCFMFELINFSCHSINVIFKSVKFSGSCFKNIRFIVSYTDSKSKTLGMFSKNRITKKFSHNLISPDIVKTIKSRKMRWVRHIACVGEMTNCKFWLENLKRGDPMGVIGVYERIILKCIS
jgi:hypothetical protein